MIQKLIVTAIPSLYSKFSTYTYHWEDTEFKTVRELINSYKEISDVGMSTDGDRYDYYHFPPDSYGRTIYRTPYNF